MSQVKQSDPILYERMREVARAYIEAVIREITYGSRTTDGTLSTTGAAVGHH